MGHTENQSFSNLHSKLNSYRENVVKLIAMESEVEFWKNRLKQLKALELPPQSEKNINKIIENLIAQIELGLRKCLCLRAECIYIIEEICDPTIKQILHLRYINGVSFEKIAEKINYCTRHVKRLHNKGIEILKEKGSD